MSAHAGGFILDWFYYRALRRKELCSHKTKIVRRAPKPQTDRMKYGNNRPPLRLFDGGEWTKINRDREDWWKESCFCRKKTNGHVPMIQRSFSV